MPPTLTQDQRESITAALFRREDIGAIATRHSISERQVRRMVANLKKHGTVNAPRLKKMGRPTILSKEIEDDLKIYVNEHPLALLEDMQKYVEEKYNVKCSRASISRRLAEMGFSRGMIRRGFRASETSLPALTVADYNRISRAQQEELERGGPHSMATGEGIDGINGNAKKTKYAWLTEGEPTRKPKKKNGEGPKAKAKKALLDQHNANAQINNDDVVVQPDLETAVANGHMTDEQNLDLERLGHEAQDRISQSHYPLPVGQQNLPPVYHHTHPQQQAYMPYHGAQDQSQFPPLGMQGGYG